KESIACASNLGGQDRLRSTGQTSVRLARAAPLSPRCGLGDGPAASRSPMHQSGPSSTGKRASDAAARRGAGLAAAGDDRALTFPGAAASRVRRCGGAAARRGSERSALRTLLQPSAARFSILVNSNMTLGRQVFTTAHELAHTFFHSRGLDV